MKRLTAIFLFMVMLLSAAVSIADETFSIVRHYTLNINGNSGQLVSGKGGKVFDFDSFTVDLYLDEEGKNGYYIETSCVDGIFLTSGMDKIRILDSMGKLRIVFGSGENIPVEWDEDNQSVWIQFSRGWFRLQLVPSFDMYTDWK